MLGVPVMIGASLTFVTVTANAARLAVALALSLTVITILLATPTSSLVGVPVSAPVVVLNVAQLGLLVILKVVVSLVSASVTLGVKLYAASSFTVVAGVPEITGALLEECVIVGSATSVEKLSTLFSAFTTKLFAASLVKVTENDHALLLTIALANAVVLSATPSLLLSAYKYTVTPSSLWVPEILYGLFEVVSSLSGLVTTGSTGTVASLTTNENTLGTLDKSVSSTIWKMIVLETTVLSCVGLLPS